MVVNSPSLTRPGLWPSEIPRHTESEAEQKVYTALKTSLPKGWYVWHSLRLRTREKGGFSEADFIIPDPNRPGILILEVKGGQIEQRASEIFPPGSGIFISQETGWAFRGRRRKGADNRGGNGDEEGFDSGKIYMKTFFFSQC